MFSVPTINDITTTFPNPPTFVVLPTKEKERDFSYPSEFFEKQSEYYKDLSPLPMATNPARVFSVVEAVARRQSDWEVVDVNPVTGRIEATATTRILRFKDDVVIEIRPMDGIKSCEVHMRSKSRVGKSDLGANAERIRSFFKQVKEEVIKAGI